MRRSGYAQLVLRHSFCVATPSGQVYMLSPVECMYLYTSYVHTTLALCASYPLRRAVLYCYPFPFPGRVPVCPGLPNFGPYCEQTVCMLCCHHSFLVSLLPICVTSTMYIHSNCRCSYMYTFPTNKSTLHPNSWSAPTVHVHTHTYTHTCTRTHTHTHTHTHRKLAQASSVDDQGRDTDTSFAQGRDQPNEVKSF